MQNKQAWARALAALVLAFLVVAGLDRMTNRLAPGQTGHVWDFVFYIDMAEHGVLGNSHLVAPYAYRIATPVIAQWINLTFHAPTYFGFKCLAYFGTITMLWGIYFLARHFHVKFAPSLIVMAIPALALFQVKFLLFDSYRPDPLAYPLLIFSFLALLKNKYWVAALLALGGLLVREFLIIPIAILFFQLILDWWKKRIDRKPLIGAIGLAVVAIAIILAPRLLLPVVNSQQLLDPIHDPNFLSVIFSTPLDFKRDINLVFNLIAYMLPVLLIATPQRLKKAWHGLGDLQTWLWVYLGVLFIEMLYGGTDLERFATYLFIPQSLLVIYILEQGVHLYEVVYMTLAAFIFNRLFLPFPVLDFTAYLNFYGGYNNTLSTASFLRWAELVGWILVSVSLRMIFNRIPGPIFTVKEGQP